MMVRSETLQSKAGYIDARPLPPYRQNSLATHGRTIHFVTDFCDALPRGVAMTTQHGDPMEAHSKHKQSHNQGDNAAQKAREAVETTAERSRELVNNFGVATNQASDVMTNCYSTALKGMQEYNSKLLEFVQANTEANIEFIQKLSGVRSPSEFVEISAEHTKRQFQTMTEQTTQLASIAQQATVATAGPLKSGLKNIYDKAA